MANTQILKKKVEPFVRQWLKERFRVSFESKEIVLTRSQKPNGKHEFDAVSKDKRIVAGIISAGGKTSRGKNPQGKINKGIAELYFLSLIEADQKLLVLTDPAFVEIFKKKTKGRLAQGIKIIHCPLSKELEVEVTKMRVPASKEVGG